MELSEFKIGEKFKQITKYQEFEWLCTDLGTRVVVAICLTPSCNKNDYHRGIPEEHIIDEVMRKECVI